MKLSIPPGLVLLTWFAALASADVALSAVTGKKGEATWNRHPVSVQIPVTWEMVRSGFGERGITSESESFRENWTFEMKVGVGIWLTSPRARIRVGGSGYEKGDGHLPTRLVLTEEELIRLLGVRLPQAEEPLVADEEETPPSPDRKGIITLNLASNSGKEDELVLSAGRQQYVSIHIRMGR